MPAGTITLTNNSTAVTGAGTAFTTELKANDFIVVVVGGTTYTLGVSAIGSATALTLTTAYGGPTTSGLSWTPIPNGALVGITAQIAADTARAIRGLNFDKANWQQVYSASGNITVTLPDGSTYNGPSWKYLSDNMATKSNGAVPLNQGGTGLTSPFGSAENTFCQGNDSRLTTVNNKSGGALTSGISVPGASGYTVRAGTYEGDTINNPITMMNVNGNPVAGDWVNFVRGGWYEGEWTLGAVRTGGASIQSVQLALRADNSSPFALWNFNANGQATGTWVNNCDRRIKDDVIVIPDPLGAMKKLRGYSWRRLDSGITGFGFVAQEVEKVFPEAVRNFGQTMKLEDGTEVENVLSVDTTGVSAALHHEAILALMGKIEKLEERIVQLTSEQENQGGALSS
jgi:hypothetical protein